MQHHDNEWRILCAAVAQEPDSKQLESLVKQLLEVFEERDRLARFRK
jgi:hypothetical protein